MLRIEENVQEVLCSGGRMIMNEALQNFDADGSPIRVGDMKLTSKGKFKKSYHTPYGAVQIERETYQSSKGGKMYCPLENKADVILNATPKYAQMVSMKYAQMGADALVDDIECTLGTHITRKYARDLGDCVGAMALSKEEAWEYDVELEDGENISTVSVSLDGTCMPMKEGGYRMAMCGSVSLHNSDGERLHTIYTGNAPEYGKAAFKERFSQEIERVKELFPDAEYIGLADGAKDNWSFLDDHVDHNVLDFYHASEYVNAAAEAIFCGRDTKKEHWLETWLTRLKHSKGGAKRLLNEMKSHVEERRIKDLQEQLEKSITYFDNNYKKMQYYKFVKRKQPIGSGVVEAACKTLVKQRLCASGMRWSNDSAMCVLKLRSLYMSSGRWAQFWRNVDKYGASL